MSPRLLILILVAFAIGAVVAVSVQPPMQSGVVRTGKALIGGPFTLTNQKGERVSDTDFRGKYMLVVFGYTYCPDICPAELQLISSALDKLGTSADKVAPIFITIDPQRDTVEQIRQYIANFSPRIVGLTGTEEEIRAAASAYRVYYTKADGPASADSYLMDHSTFIYLMNEQGEYVTHFPYGVTPEKLAEGIAKAAG
ncbi:MULTISPECIES: SCO family protein [Rhodomicrobium]|uniref:SCO family protein n=1 Tax=Rhodomicrobium TaxID=1068 RepID=UPI000B4B40D2|nr:MULTISPECIES: SCO family protein [Rhodomicrobium]